MEQAIIFKLDGCEYAIDSNTLIKIDRTPELTPVSYAPKSILGLCSTEGQIVAVYDALYLLTNSQKVDIDANEARALILQNEDKLIALMVEEVIHNVSVDAKDIEYVDNSEDAVIGFMKYKQSVVQILDMNRLMAHVALSKLARKERKQTPQSQNRVEKRISEDEKQYLIFNMQDEQFGLIIDVVREIIVDLTPKIRIANAPKEVLGLITLRNEVVPVIDLRIYFHKKPNQSDKNRILITLIDGALVGLLVDSIDDIIEIDNQDVEELSEKYKDEKVSGVAKQKSKLTTLLSTGHLKNVSSRVQAYLQNSDASKNGSADLKRDYENYDEVVIFTLGRDEYALDLEDIVEIVKFDGFTQVPASKPYIKGLINLRGEVISVVSLNEKLGIDEVGEGDGIILVSMVKGQKVGFFVDCVSDIVNIPLNLLKANNDPENIFSHTILLDGGKRMVLKMAIENLFSKKELQVCEMEVA